MSYKSSLKACRDFDANHKGEWEHAISAAERASAAFRRAEDSRRSQDTDQVDLTVKEAEAELTNMCVLLNVGRIPPSDLFLSIDSIPIFVKPIFLIDGWDEDAMKRA